MQGSYRSVCATWVVTALSFAAPLPAFSQGNPTGTISGQVVSDVGILPGVTVTVQSPNLQGRRTVVTSENGDYIFPFLPPGDYTVTFELEGFQTVKETVRVAAAQSVPLTDPACRCPVGTKEAAGVLTETRSRDAESRSTSPDEIRSRSGRQTRTRAVARRRDGSTSLLPESGWR